MTSMGRVRGVLIDRDGTVIRDVGYLRRSEQIEILPRVPEALQLLRQHGLKIVIVTNQSAVARGFLCEEELRQIHQELERQLARYVAFLDGIYYCPHHPTEGMEPYHVSCDCRKPNTGLARQAAAELNLDLGRSYVIGDQVSDVELAARIGAKGILLEDRRLGTEDYRPGSPVVSPQSTVSVVEDLWEAAQWIIRDLSHEAL